MWVKIDDGFATHPKILKAGITALAIQVRAICYASQNQTDGYIPAEALPIILIGIDPMQSVWPTYMVNHRLWDEVDGGYAVHNFLKWNVSKKDRESWKKKLSSSGKKGMKSRWNKKKVEITNAISEVITPVITDPITSLSTSTSTSTLTSSLTSSDSEFEQFWQVYPKKTGKKAALQAWKKAKDRPQVVDIVQAIESQKKSIQWAKENGQFIPNPSTWINQGRWSDKPVESSGVYDPNGFLAGMKAFIERG